MKRENGSQLPCPSDSTTEACLNFLDIFAILAITPFSHPCLPLILQELGLSTTASIFLPLPASWGWSCWLSRKLPAQPLPPTHHAQPGMVMADPRDALHLLVRTCFHFPAGGVRAWRVYLAMGLWLSKPRLQLSWTVVSVMSLTTTPPGGPGGPTPRD